MSLGRDNVHSEDSCMAILGTLTGTDNNGIKENIIPKYKNKEVVSGEGNSFFGR